MVVANLTSCFKKFYYSLNVALCPHVRFLSIRKESSVARTQAGFFLFKMKSMIIIIGPAMVN